MSELYSVKVQDKQADSVSLRITIVHPDAMPIDPQKSLALRLLRDGGAFKGAMTFEQSNDSKWVKANVDKLIASVEVKDVVGAADSWERTGQPLETPAPAAT